MCVKYAQGSCIEEGDMALPLFARLVPSLSRTRFLVLNGIGEPLLHPDLETMIAQARAVMPPDGVIGFQSNGLLLDRQRAERLLAAGLDTLCLSLDSLEPAGNGEHHCWPVARAIDHVLAARQANGRGISIGLEVVLKRQTVAQLPAMVRWAHDQGVDYIIASHLFSYDGTMEDECLFNPNSAEAVALFARWAQKAEFQGLHLADLPGVHLKFTKSEADHRLLAIGAAMQREAREREISLHFANLLKYGNLGQNDAEANLDRARILADEYGLSLTLPPLHAPANHERSCPFMAEQAVFIAPNGDVMPCHFLWHTYACRVNQGPIQVRARSLGNIGTLPLETIWRSPQAATFRREAGRSDYAPCWSCSSGPCPDLVTPNLLGMSDCYGNQVPCGHCMWSLGWTRCL
jgi:putative metalloenzyme radical SAM/SPASM domain maturase